MRSLADIIKRHHVAFIITFIVFSLVSIYELGHLRYERTFTGYLPKRSEYVQTYFKIEKEFGGGEIGLIGFSGENMLSSEVLKALKKVREEISVVEGVKRVISIFDAVDYISKPEGLEMSPLLDNFNITEKKRKYLINHPEYSGLLISKDGRSISFIVYLSEKAISDAVPKIKELVEKVKGKVNVYYSGAPFITYDIFKALRKDIEKVSPFVAFFTVSILLYFFRSISGVFLSSLTVLMSVLITFGVMGLMNEPISIVNSSIPALLFAVASAYAIHTFRGFSIASGNTDVLYNFIRISGIPILFAAITTASGFFSLVGMDLHSIRCFGFLVAIGVLTAGFISVFLIPSIFWMRKKYPEHWEIKNESLEKGVLFLEELAKKRWIRAGIFMIFLPVFIYVIPRAQYKTKQKDFFKEGSEMVASMDFFKNSFGGFDYMMIRVNGFHDEPSTLLLIDTIAIGLKGVNGVSRVDSIAHVMERAGEAMTGLRTIPSTKDELSMLLFFVEGETEVQSLYNKDEDTSMILARGDADVWPEDIGVIKNLIREVVNSFKKGKDEFFVERIRLFNKLHKKEVDEREVVLSLKRGYRYTGLEEWKQVAKKAIELNRDIFSPFPPEENIERVARNVLKGRKRIASPLCKFYHVDEDTCEVMEVILRDSIGKIKRQATIIGTSKFFYPDVDEDEVFALLYPYYAEWSGEVPNISITSSSQIVKEVERFMRVGQGFGATFTAFISAWLLYAVSRRLIDVVRGLICSIFPFLILWTAYTVLNIPIDMGSIMVPGISIGLCVDYSLHALWAREKKTDFKTLAVAILMNALSVGGGFLGMTLSDIGVTLKFGVGVAICVLIGALFAIIYFGEEGGEE